MKNKFFVLVFSVVCVGLCVVVAGLLSSVITVSGGSVSAGSFSGFKVFAISLGEFTSKSSAETIAQQTSQRGGAGFVYETDNLYYVLASAYEEENDARLVQKNLSESGISSKIIEIEIPQPEFSGISSEEQKKSFLSALSQIKSAFVKLYDISISLDTGATDETKAKIEVIATNGDLEVAHKKISRGESAVDGIYYQQISNTFNEIEDILNELKDYENISGVSLSSKIKFGYISIIEKVADLVDLINSKI